MALSKGTEKKGAPQFFNKAHKGDASKAENKMNTNANSIPPTESRIGKAFTKHEKADKGKGKFPSGCMK